MKLAELKQFAKDLKLEWGGDWPSPVESLCGLDQLKPSSAAFVKSNKYWEKFKQTFSSHPVSGLGLIVENAFWQKLPDPEKHWAKTELAWLATTEKLAETLTLFSKPFYQKKFKNVQSMVDGRQLGNVEIDPSAEISQQVFIGEHVKIAANVKIMPGCVVMSHSSIGEGTILYPNVTVYSFTEMGKNCRVHSGVVIGSDGFGYTFFQGQHQKIWHMGGVIIEDQVEIGANSAIDAGTFSPTKIGAGSKLDNFVQVAHNVKLGKGCVLCGHVGIAGSATLEDFVVLGGKAGVGPDAHLGMGTQVAGAAMVNEGAFWPAGSKLGGHPARDLKEWMRSFAYLRKMSLKSRE